jgi:DNA modification methylase
VTPEIEMHPASYPPQVPERFIRFFTRVGEVVLDPFVGSGGTLVACATSGRQGIGVDLSERYCESTRKRLATIQLPLDLTPAEQRVIRGDAMDLTELDIGPIDYCITSPPYWDMLRHSRGHAESEHRRRAAAGLDVAYSEDERDLGNVADYDEYIEALVAVLAQTAQLLRPGRYATIVLQNIRTREGVMAPLAWEVALKLRKHFRLMQETIWCQDKKRLGCWGYPTTFVSNVHHHYCLTFQKHRE